MKKSLLIFFENSLAGIHNFKQNPIFEMYQAIHLTEHTYPTTQKIKKLDRKYQYIIF